jgi:hypothetical protein
MAGRKTPATPSSWALRHSNASNNEWGDWVRIVAAGHGWNTFDNGVEDLIENLGLLKYEETADLYRKCAVGLAMMATPSFLSSFEFMATGCLPVGIRNPATTWFYQHKQNCLLSEASATCLTDILERALCEETLRANITRNALNDIRAHYSDWTPEMAKIYRFSVCRNRERISPLLFHSRSWASYASSHIHIDLRSKTLLCCFGNLVHTFLGRYSPNFRSLFVCFFRRVIGNDSIPFFAMPDVLSISPALAVRLL